MLDDGFYEWQNRTDPATGKSGTSPGCLAAAMGDIVGSAASGMAGAALMAVSWRAAW